MNPDWLDDALRSLPRESALPDFTGRVLERVRHNRRTSWVARAAIAASLVAVLGGGIAADVHIRQEREAKLEKLRAEREQLQRELDEIKKVSSEFDRSSVYLGSSGEVDLVVDLTNSGSRPAQGDIVPASY